MTQERKRTQERKTQVQQTPGDSEGQGSLACCSPWGFKELDTTEGLKTRAEGGDPVDGKLPEESSGRDIVSQGRRAKCKQTG